MAELERRVIAQPVEARAVEGEPSRLIGYAALFNSETEIAGMFRERINPGAFTDAVGRDDVRALFNHDANFVLGRTTSGTLTLSEDEAGLRYDVVPPDTTWARDLMVSVARGDISQSSFAFSVDDESWDYPKGGGMPTRTVKRATLYDVSPLTYPAYASTTVSARSLEAAKADAAPVTEESWRVELALSRDRCRLTDAATR